MRHRVLLAAPVLMIGFGLTACGGSDEPTATGSDGQSQTSDATQASQITVTDPWVKAAKTAEMTAAFGTIANTGSSDVTVVSASTDASTMVQLHETVMTDGQMQMQEKDGGFVIPAGGSLELAPGGNHIMLMGLSSDLQPGADLAITLSFADGSTATMDAVVKNYSGANENYDDGSSDDHSDMDGM